MIKNILKIEGVKVITKEQQNSILGGDFINCYFFTVNIDRFVECYDTEKESYVIFNMYGSIVDCDEIYDH